MSRRKLRFFEENVKKWIRVLILKCFLVRRLYKYMADHLQQKKKKKKFFKKTKILLSV